MNTKKGDRYLHLNPKTNRMVSKSNWKSNDIILKKHLTIIFIFSLNLKNCWSRQWSRSLCKLSWIDESKGQISNNRPVYKNTRKDDRYLQCNPKVHCKESKKTKYWISWMQYNIKMGSNMIKLISFNFQNRHLGMNGLELPNGQLITRNVGLEVINENINQWKW